MKKQLRKQILEKRKEFAGRKEADTIILKKILALVAYQNAPQIFTYVSMGTEVDTKSLIQTALQAGKKVAVPIALPESRKMFFVPINSLDGLKRTAFGVLEPIADERLAITPQKGDLFLTPGAVFDLGCNRIGYGGGYYDTYFSNHVVELKIGLAYDVQIVETVPKGKFDIPLDAVITEKRMIIGKEVHL